MKTIIYTTNNKVDEKIFTLCQRKLQEVAGDTPIISVSQKPLRFGENYCVGDIGSSWISLYKQLYLGLKNAKTKYVTIAEHDCLYTREHLDWIPPKDDTFYYNENVWLVQWGGNHPELNGMYSRYWEERKALSQLVCNRELLLDTINTRLDILDEDRSLLKAIEHAGEPGISKIKQGRKWAKSGRAVFLKQYLEAELEKEKVATFMTELPNLDIRHGDNFTGPKRGRKRCYEIPYWGKFTDMINN